MQLDEILAEMYVTTSQMESLFFELENENTQQAFSDHLEKKDDFKLDDEIRYIIEQISLSSLSPESQINLTNISGHGTIPDRASGNLKNLRLCMHAAIAKE